MQRVALSLASATFVAAQTTTSAPITATTVIPCGLAGAMDLGNMQAGCCAAYSTRVAANILTNPAYASMTSLISTCMADMMGGCDSGTNMPTTAALDTATQTICTGTCGADIITGLSTNAAVTNLNSLLKGASDANSDGVYDICVTTTTTAAPISADTVIPCAQAGMDVGNLAAGCCAAISTRTSAAILTNPAFSSMTSLVTTCAADMLGGCETSGANAGVMPTAAALDAALSTLCANSATCGTAVVSALGANAAVTNMNSVILGASDANSNGSYDLCDTYVAPTIVTGSIGLAMTLPDSATASSLASNTVFVDALATSIAGTITGVAASDVTVSNISLSRRLQEAEERELAQTATVSFDYSISTDATAGAAAVTLLSDATAFKAALKTQTDTTITTSTMGGADWGVTSVATVAAPSVTGTPVVTTTTAQPSGAAAMGVAMSGLMMVAAALTF